MSIGEFYEVVLFSTYLGQQVQNVSHYRQSAGTAAGAPPLLQEFQDYVLAQLADIQVDTVSYNRVLVRNLITETDNAEDLSPTPDSGAITSSVGMPSFVAVNFQSTRPDLSQRYSYKRFVGVPTAFVNGNSLLPDSGLEANLDQLASALGSVLTEGSFQFTPVQLHKEKVAGVWTYSENYVIQAYDWDIQLTTQNTRKPGRGD